ncbi:hypothetical protein CO049_04815 [Candidatus Roizmanbacteria bacterium CG_4_9_14_0_2_um_filter_36_12]|uniref:Peptidoglycan bridge formation protein FemAB n=1 Tax=Candidatus Roizmanbacteria bacterium CG_4_9_14_0_2_um_filter_36_12 TaxID=1974837 RepID=A0A2M8EXM7_9BACT|nr:MAG: hypothetical protein CO049_04815 [Candidatus Roizmanbacteria bacterium CG_4_9_14_0_2_um_filter_36_12]
MTNHPLQSVSWEQARKKMGIETLRIVDGKNTFQLTFHKIPYIDYKIGYLPRSAMPAKKILNQLYEYGKRNKVIFIKIEPYSPAVIPSEATEGSEVEGSKKEISRLASLARNDKRIIKSPHPLFPTWTQILDLTKSEEELLKNMHSKTRYNIRLAEKKGVVVKEESNDNGFETFARLYFETTKRQKYFGHDYRYHKIVWSNLKGKISHILVAYYNNIPLAAYELFYLDGIIYYVYGGTSEQFRNLMASNLLMWEAIKLGKRLGAKKFDMWGSLPPDYDYNHPWSGFTRFKSGYGTKFVEMIGSYDLVINPLLYQLYNFLYSLREMYLRFKR